MYNKIPTQEDAQEKAVKPLADISNNNQSHLNVFHNNYLLTYVHFGRLSDLEFLCKCL